MDSLPHRQNIQRKVHVYFVLIFLIELVDYFIAVIYRNLQSITVHFRRNHFYKCHIILRLILFLRKITWNIMRRAKI
jgi:hypothetical protein